MALGFGGFWALVFFKGHGQGGPLVVLVTIGTVAAFLILSSVSILTLCGFRAFTLPDTPTARISVEAKKRVTGPPRLAAISTVLVLGLAAAVSADPLTRYLNGYCFSQSRYISGEEFIERALIYRARDMRGLSGKASREEVQAYLRQYPECCRVEGDDFFLSSSFDDRLLGFKTTWVNIIHPLTREEIAKHPNEGRYSNVYVGLDRCGRPFRKTGEHFYSGSVPVHSGPLPLD
jgi:hypothetical protein